MDEATTSKEAANLCLVKYGYLAAVKFFGSKGEAALLRAQGQVARGVVIPQDYLDAHDVNGPERTSTLSIIAYVSTIGCFLGAAAAFTIGERYGRKTIIIRTFIMAIGVVLQMSSFNIPHMIDRQGNQNGRCADVTDGDVQGQQPKLLVVFETSMNIVGYPLSSWTNYSVAFDGGSGAWRFPLAVQLNAHGREKEATEILANQQECYTLAGPSPGPYQGRRLAAHQHVFYPETANCAPEDLDAYYRGDPPLLVFCDLDSVSVRWWARFALAHDRGVEEAAQELRRRSVFAHPGYKSSRSL
ncbi:hypothetical protein DL768_001623 [Monosporascus sp. mg162]|nr:hypothetical protein DL768_001623 [Monosporascus sp. mg162]